MLTSNASRSALPVALAVLAVIACSEESPSPDAASDAGDAAVGQDAIPDAPTSGDGAPADGPDAPAGGPDAPADAASTASTRSGSRLKARWSAAPDGRRLFRGWYDSLLATNCMFLPASDRVLRCLPGDTLLLEQAVYYGDSACTAPVVESGRTLPSQFWAVLLHAAGVHPPEPSPAATAAKEGSSARARGHRQHDLHQATDSKLRPDVHRSRHRCLQSGRGSPGHLLRQGHPDAATARRRRPAASDLSGGRGRCATADRLAARWRQRELSSADPHRPASALHDRHRSRRKSTFIRRQFYRARRHVSGRGRSRCSPNTQSR